ncbi:family 2 encapsulin nanocompartment cargo protein polyprenyl transferase [Streptomyces odontomachi]|uniref:family 2 encapsulin nanocompartment cargo protein polyprenyl transferase n=1 Tax=Streptomyces odontomachi TaxID=2944940 RepID=UPI00210C04FB|nr:family 2 encapsulin nanocompartment cargo protein polyprenyl transferase [Streptomyces sp. ODS25]
MTAPAPDSSSPPRPAGTPTGRTRPAATDAIPGRVPGPARREPAPEHRAPSAEQAVPADRHDAALILAAARATVDPELHRAIGTLPAAMRRVALHHFGWSDGPADGRGVPSGGGAGKAIRPALVFAATRALGGRTESVARAAAAVELVHNFTLLHDDVMDRDTTRRHRPTAWTVFGVPDAILAGDALQALAQRLLVEDPHPAAAAAAARIALCVIELCEGQQVDTALEQRAPDQVTLDECLVVAEAKTGALIGCACAVGALYAGAEEETVAALDAFGREAGLAFQLIDDVIGIWGDPRRTGKPAGADLLARKKSLPVVAALESRTPAAAELVRLYSAEAAPTVEDLERTALAVEEAGGRDWAQSHAADRMARAVQQLSRAIPDPVAAGGLLSLAEFVTRRSA